MTKTPSSDSKKTQDDPGQSKRFEEKARELEADEDGKAFSEAMKVIVPPKRPPTEPSGLP